MVRPAARYRPGARRFGAQLTPIFAVRKDGGELYEIWSGATGLLASVRPWEDVAPPSVSTSPIGLDDLMVSGLGGSSIAVVSQSETPQQSSNLLLITSQLVDGVLYLMFQRAKWVIHSMEVRWRNKVLGVPSGSTFTETTNIPISAAYDVATYAIALDSGVVSASTATHYNFAASATRYYSFAKRWDWTATETLAPLPLAITESLPSSHPFENCGQAIWSDVSFAEQTQNYASTATDTPYAAFKFFNDLDLIPMMRSSSIVGLNTTSALRVIRAGSDVLQFSGYQPAEDTESCSLYRVINAAWLDSFDTYSPASITERDQVFPELDAMTPEDRELFLTSELEPPATLTAGSSTLAATTDPIYFMEADVMLAAVGSFEFDAGLPRDLYYLIGD